MYTCHISYFTTFFDVCQSGVIEEVNWSQCNSVPNVCNENVSNKTNTNCNIFIKKVFAICTCLVFLFVCFDCHLSYFSMIPILTFFPSAKHHSHISHTDT